MWSGTLTNDVLVILGVKMFGENPWAKISEYFFKGTIQGTQILERYQNILDPKISHLPFTALEDQILLDAISKHGNKWTYIAANFFTGEHRRRTDNQIKRRATTLKNQ